MIPPSESETAVRAFVRAVGGGSVADAADRLTDDGAEAVVRSFPDEFRDESMRAEDALEAYYWGLYGQYGSVARVGDVSVDGSNATVTVEFQAGSETAHVGVDDDGITDLSFSPRYELPDYVDERRFGERSVTVDAEGARLDGVLTVPEGSASLPAVSLVHGAGVHDPDGTAGASKLLKDVAWGLASEGVASLRYENRLGQHDVPDDQFTLDRVVTDDAVAALDTLVAAEEVADDAVFVAGHSRGGMCAPRIAERHGDVAGVVNLDGLADPVLDPDDVEFFRYEFEVDGVLDDEQEAQLDADRETARRIAEGAFDDDETLWGRPGTWHRSVRAYDPVDTAGRLGCPVFVAKTCRADPELQPELDAWLRKGYDEWRTATLPPGSRVERYEGLDHFLQRGFSPTGPLSIYFGGDVAEEVVSDLAAWIHDVTDE